jgi:uridine kinase
MTEAPRIVGIAGGSGSGKTTVTAALMKRLGPLATLLQQDWYYRDQSALSPRERAALNYDHPDAQETNLLVNHLETLCAGSPVEAPQYDFATHTRRPDTVPVLPCPWLVVEGINALAHEGLRARCDLTVYVDAPADIRFIRRLQRDVAERGRTAESVIAQYLDQVRPMHETYVEPCKNVADLVLSGEAPVAESVDRILARLDQISKG